MVEFEFIKETNQRIIKIYQNKIHLFKEKGNNFKLNLIDTIS